MKYMHIKIHWALKESVNSEEMYTEWAGILESHVCKGLPVAFPRETPRAGGKWIVAVKRYLIVRLSSSIALSKFAFWV